MPKRIQGEYRLIHHLSSPKGSSVNDCIDREECTVTYSDFDEAVKLVVALGRNAFMGKSDIKSAFRLLPVNPADFDLLGMCFDGQFYFDRCMPMGCSVSCAVVERFSSFLQACCRRIASSQGILHYLDDFFFVGRAADECAHLMRCFRAMCDRFGIPIADEKTEGPVQVITYLGLEIDSTELQVRVPKEKLRVLLSMLDDFASKSKLTLRHLQSLTGSLNFVCKAIGPGRAFLRRLIDLTRGVHKAHHRIRISKGAKADLLAWREFLLHFNGTVCFGDSVWRRNDFFQFYTDAAGSIGFGIYFESRWAQARWPEEVLDAHYSIGFLELFPIVVGVAMWGKRISGRKVVFWSDNRAVVAVINKQSSTCSHIMGLIRRLLVVLCLRWNIHLKAKYVPGVDNEIADSLSRFQMERFRRLAPDAELAGTPPTSPSVEQLFNERRVLLGSSRAQNTMRTYALAWSTFQIFRGDYQFDILQAPNIEQIALFISYMSWHKFAASTIAAYVSGLSFYLRMQQREGRRHTIVSNKAFN